ncbi:zinc finger BED domain-containing protein 1 [Elysia marginata]|uniref:Zinc finger BED domain-containing protein 1 n=1 Tax=Elysia marginata TaxID=1093978 RepID=A0AAV4G352_9GAST|nr:zinc finger BED domain-containing protein 1 [Elysia marginata]
MLPCNRKNASSIWSMMTKSGPGLAKCNLCGQEFKCSKGTSNLPRHVKSKHGTDSDVLAKVEGKSDQTPGSLPHKSLALQPTIEAKMSSIAKYRPEAPKKKVLDKKLLCMIYRDMQPFSIVDDAGFKEFCKEMDPRYELPSRRQLKRSLSTVHEEEKNLLAYQLLRVDSVAITTDSWTSLNMESFLTITAHYLEPLPSWQLRNVVLATRLLDKDQLGSSVEGMSNLISEVLMEFGIKDKLYAATTDNASSMVSLVKNHLKVLHVRCFAHTLNLIVKDSIKACAELNLLIEAVKKVVNYFHKSAKATAKLKLAIDHLGLTQLKLCQDVETRWNATLKMLRRYCQLHRPVSGALMALGKSELIISDNQVEGMMKACECLEPFEEATEMMSTEKTTSLSKILVVVRQYSFKVFLTQRQTSVI